jgi:hypothetical protein
MEVQVSLFKKLGHVKGDLKCTSLSLSGFVGDPTEAEGIICIELTVGSKTVPTTFFIVDVMGCYNMPLGRDWIHANEYVPSILNQCVIVQADEDVCIAVIESQVDIQGGKMKSGREHRLSSPIELLFWVTSVSLVENRYALRSKGKPMLENSDRLQDKGKSIPDKAHRLTENLEPESGNTGESQDKTKLTSG